MNDTQEKDVASADSTKIQFSKQNETHRKRMLHQLILQSTFPGAAEKKSKRNFVLEVSLAKHSVMESELL